MERSHCNKVLIDFDKSPSHVLKKNSEARGVGEEKGNWHRVRQVIEKWMEGSAL